MLGKLLKHEWKSIWKVPTILIGLLLMISVFSGFTFSSPVWYSEMGGLDVLVVLVWIIYYFSLIGVSLGITLYLAIHFYKSMYTDEGYLTHTLPVTSHQLLISKILPMMAWSLLSGIGVGVSIMVFGSIGISFLKPDGMTLGEVVKAGLRFFEQQGLFDKGYISFWISIIFMGIVSIINGTMMIAGSISIGQLVGKHKVLGSIGAYFAISTVMQICAGTAILPIMMINIDTTDNVFRVLTPSYWMGGVVMVLVSAALYFISEYLIRRKLNLD